MPIIVLDTKQPIYVLVNVDNNHKILFDPYNPLNTSSIFHIIYGNNRNEFDFYVDDWKEGIYTEFNEQVVDNMTFEDLKNNINHPCAHAICYCEAASLVAYKIELYNTGKVYGEF